MPRLHRWRTLKLALLHGWPDAEGLAKAHASGKSKLLWRGHLQYSPHSHIMLVDHRGQAAGVVAPSTDQPQVKSP